MSKIECIARGLVQQDGRVLACRSVKHGHRYLPGGHIEPGESAAAALGREFLEETGLAVRVGEPCLIAEVRFRKHHELNVVFHVEHVSGRWPEQVSSVEPKLAFDWLTPDALADSASRFLPAAIREWLLARDSGAAAWFQSVVE